MKDIMRYIKQQTGSCVLIMVIWIVCMIPVPETPLDNVKFIDKWTHLCMYGCLVLVIMAEYGRRKRRPSKSPCLGGLPEANDNDDENDNKLRNDNDDDNDDLLLATLTKSNTSKKEKINKISRPEGEGDIKNDDRFNIKRLIVGGLLAPIVMGGLVELAQAYLTNGTRSGDWLDFAANSCGALIGAVIGIPLARFLATRNKGD